MKSCHLCPLRLVFRSLYVQLQWQCRRPCPQCSTSCGIGVRTRAVYCASASGAPVPQGRCTGRRPRHERRCRVLHCSHVWRTSNWGKVGRGGRESEKGRRLCRSQSYVPACLYVGSCVRWLGSARNGLCSAAMGWWLRMTWLWLWLSGVWVLPLVGEGQLAARWPTQALRETHAIGALVWHFDTTYNTPPERRVFAT